MKHLLAIFFFSLAIAVMAQTTGRLPSGEEVKQRIDRLNQIAKEYLDANNTDSSLHYLNQVTVLTDRYTYPAGTGIVNQNLGESYRIRGEYEKSKAHFITALKIWEGQAENSRVAECLYNLGIVSSTISRYEEAEQYIRSALRIFEKMGNQSRIGHAYMSLANNYYAQSDYTHALENYYHALRASEDAGDKRVVAYSHYNIAVIQLALGNHNTALNSFVLYKDYALENNDISAEIRAYNGLSTIYRLLNDHDKALEYARLSIDLAERMENKHLIAANKGNYGRLLEAQGDLSGALNAYLETIEILESAGDKRMLGGFSYYAGNMYNKLNQPQQAIPFFEKSLKIGQGINVGDLIKDSYEGLQEANDLLGNHKEAYEHYKNFVTYKDSLYNEENTKKLTRLEVQYEADKKQDSLSFVAEQERLSIQKEMQLAALRHEYERKQALAKSEEERRQLLVEEEMKRQQIEGEYAIAQAESKRKEAELLAEQEHKEAIAKVAIEREKGVRNVSLAGLLLFLAIGGFLYYQNRVRKRHNHKLRALNAELDQANRVKARFFSILNHDLRSPVSNLIHFLHLKKENPELLDEETKNRLEEKTTKGAENLLVTMEDLLLWSKGQMENFAPKPERITVSQLFEDTQKLFSGYQRVAFEYYDLDGIELFTDPNYLKTIIRNLTSNAIHAFTATVSPKIVWQAFEQDGKIVLSITDNGPGADNERFRALYDDKEVVGIKTGLGLHLIRDLAKAIDCTIEVDSEKSKGTRINLKMN